MICTRCAAEVRPGLKFCPQCGVRLGLLCPACGAPGEEGFRFCGECGADLRGRESGEPATRLGEVRAPATAERRLVSVLFADLVGFTGLAEQRDAEEVRELLTRYFDASRQVIVRYGGAVEKFIGDAVMAVWGTPTAREDDAERAVRAALELTTMVAALGGETGVPDLRLRAGVVTGEAAITVGAEGQGMVAGDVVNTASRIQSLASPNSVLVDEATRRATEVPIVYEDGGIRALKGKAEPVHLWRADRVVATVRGVMRSGGLEAPFAGRDRELRMVKELFHATVDESRARLVSIVGLAGIGKSRLAWEFEKYIDGLADVVLWHRGRCLSYGEGVTYWALAEMVRRRADILEGEDPIAALAKLRATIDQYIADADEQRWLEPRLAHLLSLEDRIAPERVDLFAAWRLFFERIAEQAPTVMIFEEMQWADAALVDFIEYLLEWSRHHRLYIISLARPELTHRHPKWSSAKRSFHSLYLEPLSPDAMDALLAGLVPGLPADARSTIRDRAEGIPLYAVETVRMLLDRGTLRREANRYALAGPVGDLDVPQTLHALIAARLDSLTTAERSLIQDAAVLGQSFSRDRLATLSQVGDGELDALLEALLRKEFLTVQADPTSPERGQYAFLQALVQRVAYDTLSKRERKARHLEVARQLDEARVHDADEWVEVVASHYLEAYRAEPGDPDAAEIRDEARRLLVRAGQRAASLAATEEAERYFVQAADLADDPSESAGLLERAGEMARRAGRVDEATEHFERGIALFEREGRHHPAARVSARLGELIWNRGQLAEAVDRMEQSFAVLSGDAPDGDLAAVAAQLARFHFFVGHPDRGAELVEFALGIAEALGQAETIAEALATKSIFLRIDGRPEEAIALLRHALHVALENDIGAAALRCSYNLSDQLVKAGRIEAAIAQVNEGVALARRLGDRFWEWSLLSNMLYPLYIAGRWDEVLERVAEMPVIERLGGQRAIISTVAFKALVDVNRGDLDEGRRVLKASAELETSPDVQDRSVFFAIRAVLNNAEGARTDALNDGRVGYASVSELGAGEGAVEGFIAATEAALTLGDDESASRLIEEARGLRRVDATPYMCAHMARFEARLMALRGGEGVDAAFSAAIDGFRQLSVPFGLALTLLEHGDWLMQNGRIAEAAPLLDEARTIFEELRAAPWLERVDGIVPAAAALAKPTG